jgi:hypothetical protein
MAQLRSGEAGAGRTAWVHWEAVTMGGAGGGS